MPLKHIGLCCGSVAAVLLIALPLHAQSVGDMQQSVVHLDSVIKEKNFQIEVAAKDRTLETMDNYDRPERLITGYDLRNIGWIEVTDPLLLKRVDTLFARSYPSYRRDTTTTGGGGGSKSKSKQPPAQVQTAAVRIYLGKMGTIRSGGLKMDYEIMELRILKKIQEPVWDDEEKEWGVGQEELVVYSKVGTGLKFMLDGDPTLYQDILDRGNREKMHQLPEDMFQIPSRGPFVVKSDQEIAQYSTYFSGFTVALASPSGAVASTSGRIKVERQRRGVTGSGVGAVGAMDTSVVLDLSMFRAMLAVYNWNLDVRLGDEEFGYPFWSSGELNVMAGYKNLVKLGVTLHTGLGKDQEWNIIGPVGVKPRALDGIFGLTGRFNLDRDFPVALGGAFTVGSLEKEYESLTNSSLFYYIPTALQVYYPVLFKDAEANARNIVQIKIGYGFHRVKSGHVIQKSEIGILRDGRMLQQEDVGTVVSTTERDVNSPYVKVEFMNLNENNKYGFSVQYYGGSMIIGAWLEIVPDIFRIEGKYATLLRDKYPWDSSPILLFSPRVRLDFGKWFK